LWTITNRKLSQFFSRQNRDRAGAQAVELLDGSQMATAEPEWSAEFDAEVLRVALVHAREHFEPITWRAFELAWLAGNSAAAVAIELEIPIETVYVAKSRVLKRLEEEVRTLAEDLPQVLPLRPS
jgi:RNA polymerase sigma-70 factor (ECF subfamily)